MKPLNTERDANIRAMRKDGIALQRIGSRFWLSKERIRQICGEANSPSYFKQYDSKHKRTNKDGTGMKITAIHGGGDWSDASADYLVLPDGMDVDAEMDTRDKWLREEFRPAMRRGENPEYISILDWLLRRGAVKPTEDQLEVVYCG